MSDRTRNLLTVALLILLAGSAFAAGYFTNDFIALRSGTTLAQERDHFDVFWEAWGYVENNYLGELPTTQELTYGAIRGAVGLLDDPYTVFVEPVAREEERISLSGRFGGVGATLTRPEAGGDIVLDPVPEYPAAVAGIVSGDVLLAVDGIEITPEMTVQEVAEMIRGEVGTPVILTVRHPGETGPVDIEIARDNILLPSVTYRLVDEDERIGYIQLSRFSAESSKEVAEAIIALRDQGAEKLILDLRHNGGGLVDAAVSVTDHFLGEGVVLYQRSRDQGERVFESSNETLAPGVPLAVLIDGGTASASEILVGALRDRDRATLIGQQTFGKGSVQLVFDLSDGSSVHVTSARWYTPGRQVIDEKGLEPDIAVAVTQEDIDNGRDPMLNAAIEFLGEQ